MVSDDEINRHEAAKLLGISPDRASDIMAQGLAACVIGWGVPGKPHTYSRRLVSRWGRARRCVRDDGGPCHRCRMILEDVEFMTRHVLATRHGVGGCDDCRDSGALCEPCSAVIPTATAR